MLGLFFVLRSVHQLLPVHPHKLLHQLIFGLHMGGIPEDAVHVEQMLMPELLPVHPDELFHQLIVGFHMGVNPEDAVPVEQTLMPESLPVHPH